jgi:SAM-dependent methyltransferase
MLGRLKFYTGFDDFEKILTKYPNVINDQYSRSLFKDEYSEPLFRLLGADDIQSMDYSDYEQATILHDLNVPVESSLHGKFSCVIDSGTLEHVFNYPVAIKSCMQMLRKGGHFIGISPANNQLGHGFYQFSPELIYRVFSEENGFRIVKLFLSVEEEGDTHWYEVPDPQKVKSRIEVVNSVPLFIRFIAEKIEEKDVFKQLPVQSDYVSTWDSVKSIKTGDAKKAGGTLSYLYKKLLPYRVKVVLRNLYNIYKVDKIDSPHLGNINSEHFRKVEL